MNLEACLPADLRTPTTTITRIAAGLSGAGVYRVDAAGQAFVLKLSGDDRPLARWRRSLDIQRRAAAAGLAPRVVHADEERRAVVTAFVVDRSFAALLGHPGSRDAALAQLGRTLRRVHDLALPVDAEPWDAPAVLATIWSRLASFAVPAFVSDAVRRQRAEAPPAVERAPVLSHNDVNPSNLIYDGADLLLLDWDTSGPNDPFHDLATISVFLRMDEATCRALLAAHDGESVAALPARFGYARRLVAVMCGVMFVHLARESGHPGGTTETLDATAALGEIYLRMRAGSFSVGTPDGQWQFGLALIKESFAV